MQKTLNIQFNWTESSSFFKYMNSFKDSENLSDVTTQNFICHLNVFVMTTTKIILYAHTHKCTYRLKKMSGRVKSESFSFYHCPFVYNEKFT